MKEGIRIIGGLYRGKKIPVPAQEDLRPTPNRVRETLFNWLMHDIREARCLDAFAGSGSLGLEAFSRGASHVTFIEQSAQAYQQLHQVIKQFNSPKLHLLQTDAYQYLQSQGPSYNIVFLDPPFAHNALDSCLHYLSSSSIVEPEGLVYIESDKAPVLDATCWQQIKLQQAGQVVYGLFKKV
jgi:16S rRNA (guanine966-N2)-methyltransferase